MAGYLSEEIIAPFAGASALICFAHDQSSNPDHTPYYCKILEPHAQRERSLGALAALETITPAVAAAMPPTLYQQHRPVRVQFPARMPTFVFGCPHAAIVGVLFRVDYPYSLFRLVDTVQHQIIAEYLLSHGYRAHFNSTGTRCLVFGSMGSTAFNLDDGMVPVFTVDHGDGADTALAYQPMWCAQRWCVFQRRNRAWFLTVLDEATGRIVDRVRLHGRPDRMSAAQDAPIIACSLSNQRVEIINLDTRRSQVVRAPKSAPRSATLGIHVAPNGRHILARSWVDDRLWDIGDDMTMMELMRLPRTEITLSPTDFLLATPGFCALNDRYLTLTRGTVTAHPYRSAEQIVHTSDE